MRKLWKILRWTLVILVLFTGTLFFAVRIPAVQTWLGQRVADYLTSELGAEVEVGGVSIDLWARLVLNNVYVEDQKGDTLVFIPAIHIRTYTIDKETGLLSIGEAELDNPDIQIIRHKGEKNLNYVFIIDYFSQGADTTDTSAHTLVDLAHLRINEGRVRYINENRPVQTEFGIDWNHLDFKDVQLDIRDFHLYGDTIIGNLSHLAAKEKSGFNLHDFDADVSIIGGDVQFKDALICTDQSEIVGNLGFKLNSIDDFDFFEDRVKMNHQLQHSFLQLGELAYFTPEFKGLNKRIEISGKVRGTVASLKGKDIRIDFDENSYFDGDFSMDGLPYINETFISLDINRLTSNKYELEQIPLPPFDTLQYLKTPENFATLGQINFSGNFTGFINDFVAYGNLSTEIGEVSSDISLRFDSIANDYFYKGNLATTAFNLGQFYSDATLGPLTSNLEIEGKGLNLKKVDAQFSGDIPAIYLNGYNYSNITAQGTFRKEFFNGYIQVNDPNMVMDFDGQVDFNGAEPMLSFNSHIDHLDLKRVHILPDYEYSAISGDVTVDCKGFDLAKIEGSVILDDISYCSADQEYFLDHLELYAERKGELVITLNSDIAQGRLEGDFDFRNMSNTLLDISSKIVPSFKPPLKTHAPQKFLLNLEILDFSEIQGIFIPDLSIAPNTTLSLNVDETQSFFEITISSDSIEYLDNRLDGLVVDASRPDQSLYMNLSSDSLTVGENLIFKSFALDTRTDVDTVYSALVWGDSTTVHRGDVNGVFTIRGFENFDYKSGRGFIEVNKQQWNFIPGGIVSVDSTTIAVSDFVIQNKYQSLAVEGAISEDENQELNILLSAFDLDNINPLMDEDTQLHGSLNGIASVRNVYHNTILTSDLTLLNFKLNDYSIGDLCLETGWNNQIKSLRIDGELEKANQIPLSFGGYYTPSNEKSPIDIMAKVNNLDLAFINSFIGEDVLSIFGQATGLIRITGLPEAPELTGDAYLNNASIYVDYLNCSYKIKNKIGIRPDMFTFDYVPILDKEGHEGSVTGQIMHKAFGDWNFDFIIDLPQPMLTMNTNEDQNPLYYGKAYTTGYVGIFGFEDQLEFDMALRTEAGTSFAMPMNTTEEQTFENFIRFVDADTTVVDTPLDLTGIRLNMQLEITPDAQMEVIFDKAVGDVMRGRGRGNITMEINNLSTFNMYGVVELQQGDYLFTLKNLVNKEFTVKQGGTISWYGDPYGGELNLDAVYKVSASLYDIIPDVTQSTGQRTPVDLVMNLTGKMFNPAVGFEISLPTVDEITRSRVGAVISTDQEKNRQAFALLVLRRFVSPLTPTITKDRNTNSAFTENSTELLSNQISNWLSQISDDFNLGFNYRPGDDISNEEIALALSTQLFNERLSLSGNFGVSRGTSANQKPSNVIGDVRIEYKINDDGRIRLVVYNESNDYRGITTQQSPYTQGVGILYQQEFDNWDQFTCGFRQLFVDRKRRTMCP